MKILQAGAAVLRQPAKMLSRNEIRSGRIQDLIESMRETMYEAPGVGLAAPQVGVPLQLAVIEDKPEYMKDSRPEFLKQRGRSPVPFHVIVNPKISLSRELNVVFFEGCLSVAGFTAAVPRARAASVECLDHKGEQRVIEAAGWYARILQHEIDHLHASLYIDRMHTRTFMTVDNFNTYWKDKPIEEILDLSGIKG
jgi:peptide deformylase